jgi:hypothetical protein
MGILAGPCLARSLPLFVVCEPKQSGIVLRTEFQNSQKKDLARTLRPKCVGIPRLFPHSSSESGSKFGDFDETDRDGRASKRIEWDVNGRSVRFGTEFLQDKFVESE